MSTAGFPGLRRIYAEESGISFITVIGALFTLIAVGVFTLDAGYMWVARTQLQAAADSSALAGAADLVDPSSVTVTLGAAEAAAIDYAAQNDAAHQSVVVASGDLE